MPESKKKKSKHEEKKVSLLIKKEPEDLKSLEHYVDDRVELIKHIFSSLKSKTIESIIPDFLQDKSSEEIQEICLEEVLGISKKRLLSIINATKCPTDTESSDSGSDVEKVEEHISLEEISSDSNDELSKPKKKRKRDVKKETTSKAASKAASKTVPKPIEQNGEKNEPEKQYSVLELLELQARARAIRSQLAQEPVTKIELDDSDTEMPAKTIDKDKVNIEPPSQNNGNHKEKESSNQPEEQTNAAKTRPVRLKRNFRQRQMEGYESDERSRSVGETESTGTAEPKTPEKTVEREKSPENDAEPAAVHDDDVVPIIAEPEILCISSSDSENEEKEEKKDTNKVKRSYITMPVVEKEVRPPTEDELFLLKIKEKSEAKRKAENLALNDPKADGTNSGPQSSEKQNKEAEEQKNEEEMEDGEIVDEDEIFEIPESPETATTTTEQKLDESAATEKDDENDRSTKTIDTSTQDTEKSHESDSSASESDNNESSDDENSGSESDSSEQKAQSQTSKKSTVDDDDDDIIDLGKDEDLDFEQLEMSTTQEEPPEEGVSTRRTRSKTNASKSHERKSPADVEPKDESWDKRWLRGSKVSKVLATAKLANKVRSKIKEKKTKTVAAAAPKPEEIEQPTQEAVPDISPDKLGSVEHYKELTKQTK